jgi:hypothetical protein
MELSAYSGWTGPSSLAGSGGCPPGTPRDRAGFTNCYKMAKFNV